MEEGAFGPELDRGPPEEKEPDEKNKQVLIFIELHKETRCLLGLVP
jgi:hypothetical protein